MPQYCKVCSFISWRVFIKCKRKSLEVLSNTGRDLKLQLDIDTEKLIKDHITSDSSYPILGEETGSSGDLDNTYWVVDPLDGTSNFFKGHTYKLCFNCLNARYETHAWSNIRFQS